MGSSPNTPTEIPTIDHAQVHADPTTIPLKPLAESRIVEISTQVSNIPTINKVALAQTGADGALEIHYTTTKNTKKNSVNSTIISTIETAPLEIVTPTKIMGVQREIPKNNIDRAVKVVEHPLKHPLNYCLRKAKLSNTSISWSISNDELSVSPDTVLWENTSPITISFTEESKDKLNTFKQTLKEVTPPSHPADYYLEVTETFSHESTEQDKPHASGAYELSYTPLRGNSSNNSKDIVILQGNAAELTPSSDSDIETPNTKLARQLTNTTIEDRVQLTVTSPPYLDAINYDAYEDTQTDDYSGDTNDRVATQSKIAAWKDSQKQIFNEVYKSTKEGGYCAVIIGTTKSNGEFIDLPAEFSRMMTNGLDWNLQEKITWNKITGGNSLFGTTIQHNEPKYYQANQMTEVIYVFRKGDAIRQEYCDEEILINDFVKQEIANNVWNIPPTPHNTVNHPCPYPAEIPYRLISLYTYDGETVLDPMAGSGTTLKTANHLNRKGVGVEIKPKFVKEARKRALLEDYDRNDQKIMRAENIKEENAQILKKHGSKRQGNLTEFSKTD
jgi:site-specific DNA-methyltransferase (adenine-specific)